MSDDDLKQQVEELVRNVGLDAALTRLNELARNVARDLGLAKPAHRPSNSAEYSINYLAVAVARIYGVGALDGSVALKRGWAQQVADFLIKIGPDQMFNEQSTGAKRNVPRRDSLVRAIKRDWRRMQAQRKSLIEGLESIARASGLSVEEFLKRRVKLDINSR